MKGSFKITSDVQDVLKRSKIEKLSFLDSWSLTLPDGQLPRALYSDVNKVLEGIGGKWNRKSKAHLFSHDPREELGLAVETGVAVNEQQQFQSFYTPPDLARRVAELADIGTGMRVLEPSAGEGALLDVLFESKRRWCTTMAFELNPKAVRVLRAKGYLVQQADFLLEQPAELFDRVLMNPPFGNQQDIVHVTHAMRFLKPGGILVAVVSPSVKFRTDKKTKTFRKLLADNTSTQYEVDAGTFRTAGTEIATVIVKIQKTSGSGGVL